MKLRGSLQQQLQQFEAGADSGDPELGADIAALFPGVGSGGIGEHVAAKFAAEGYKVAMLARSD